MKELEEILVDVIIEERKPDIPKKEMLRSLKEDGEPWVQIAVLAMREAQKEALKEASEKALIMKLDEDGRGEKRKSFVIGGDIYAVDEESIIRLLEDKIEVL